MMIDQHTLAILCRGIRDGDNQYLSIGFKCSWKEALDAADIIGSTLGYTKHTSCNYYERNNTVHLNFHLTEQLAGKESYITITVPHGTPSGARQMRAIILGSLCLSCNKYVGRDSYDLGAQTYCAECAERLDIGEPASNGRTYHDDDYLDSVDDRELV